MHIQKKRVLMLLSMLMFALSLNSFTAFAWNSNLTTTLSSTTVIIGNPVFDTATLTVSHGGSAQPTGSITFYIYSGTCNSKNQPTGNLVMKLASVNVNHAGSYQSPSWDTTGQSPGNYTFVVKYSGGNGYPPATAPCETFKLVNGSSVPEFPAGSLGLGALFALSIPLLAIIRRRSTT